MVKITRGLVRGSLTEAAGGGGEKPGGWLIAGCSTSAGASNESVNGRNHEDGEGGADDHAGNEDNTDAITSSGARPMSEDEGQVAEDRGSGGHENGAKAGHGSLDGGLDAVKPLLLQVIGKLHNENAVFGNKTDER